MFTDLVTRNLRTDTCILCSSKNGARCKECKCFIIFLVKVKTAKCPLKKW